MKHKPKYCKWPVLILGLSVLPNVLFAAGPPKESELSNPLAQALVAVIIVLLLCIALLANVVMGAAKLYLQRFQEERDRNKTSGITKVISIVILLLVTSAVFAQDATNTAAPQSELISGLTPAAFYGLFGVILIELIVLFILTYNLRLLLQKEAAVMDSGLEVVKEEHRFAKWWDKFNSFRPIKEESSIDLGHDYDGIRELDNRLPGWWVYGFVFCIIFAAGYLWRYHVAHSAPLSQEELTIALEKAEIEKEAYLKKAANNIDENTVKLLNDPADLAAGKQIFTTVCAACHVADGGGLVGPNLTDDYWLHGGSLKDIFKTIKYGVQEKGMKSWKDDYSPKQIAQLASYVKSLRGTKPAKPKEPQGTLFVEAAVSTTDSTTSKTETSTSEKK